MSLTTLVTGSSPAAREAAIAAALGSDASATAALILEGLPDGTSRLDALAPSSSVHVVRIAPGCICCTGNLTMRVSLNRVLRMRPARLYISLSTSEHVDSIRDFLSRPPYDQLLTLTKDLHA